MAFAVNTHRISLGNYAAVINEVTGDGSTQYWQTGLSRVMFYIGVTAADSDLVCDKWYLNYSDAGSTAANGTVFNNAAAPDDGEVWYCFGIGRG
jgi:hypothetical protein